MSETKKILAIGVDASFFKIVRDIEQNIQIDEVNSAESFEALFTKETQENYLFILCGNLATFTTPLELAQGLRSLFQEKRMFYVISQMEGYERKNMLKNGFDEVFILPADYKYFIDGIGEFLSSDIKRDELRAVRLADITSETILDFNVFVYMPMNRKYLKYAAAGYPIEGPRLERLKSKNLGVIFVPKNEIKSFYKYTAVKLKNLADVKNMSRTEAYEKTQLFIRNVFSDIFDHNAAADFETGKQILSDCKNIISCFVSEDDTQDAWLDKLNKSIGLDQVDTYSHAMNVSIFASLFAIGLGYKNIEDFAVAGLFHDLGLVEYPADLEEKNLMGLTDEELKVYQAHPEKTLNMLKEKRIIITNLVQKMIMQHHENYDGSGFPEKLQDVRVCEEAQVIQIASYFDVMTRHSRGEKTKTPQQFMESLREDKRFNPELVNKLYKLFVK